MTDGLIIVVALAVAGFLLGGVWALWCTARFIATALAFLGLLAVAGGVLWMVNP